MSTRMRWAAGAAAVLLATPLAAEDFQWRGRVAAGKTVEIKGVNGAIEATAADGDEVEVTATKRGRRSSPGSVRIEAIEHAGGVTVCAVYPDVDGRPQRMPSRRGRADEHPGQRRGGAFHGRIPRGVAFAPRTVNGEVEATDLEGDVDAQYRQRLRSRCRPRATRRRRP